MVINLLKGSRPKWHEGDYGPAPYDDHHQGSEIETYLSNDTMHPLYKQVDP